MKIKLLFILILISGCKTIKPVFIEKEVRDSIMVKDTVVEYILKPYKEKVTTLDTISLLENEYAITRAETSGGKLKHSLETKEKPVEIKVQYLDRVITKEIPVPYEVEKVVEVEKKLNLWERLKLKLGGIVIILFVAYFAQKFIRRRV